MSRRIAIDPKFSPEPRSNQGQIDGPVVDRDENADIAADVFKQACGAFGSGKEVAFALKLDQAFVCRLAAAEKRVALADCLPLLRKKESALAFINALCDIAGVAHAKPKRTITKRESERQLVLQLRRLAGVYELVRKEAAAQLGTHEDEIDESLDDVTQEHYVGVRK